MLQLLMNQIQELEKRPVKGSSSGPVNGWSRRPRSNSGLYCYTSNFVVEKATQTPSDLHVPEGCTLWLREAREPNLRGYRRRFAYGYPERITEEKQVLAILNRKIVKQQIEFLPPFPDPFAKRRPREVKKAEWHAMYY